MWEHNINKTVYEETGCKSVEGIYLAKDGPVAASFKYRNVPSSSVKGGKYID
jgi:hypothetical protein